MDGAITRRWEMAPPAVLSRLYLRPNQMTLRKTFPHRLIVHSLSVLSLCASSSLFAADLDYTGISGGEWATIDGIQPNTGSNWEGGSYPGSDDFAFLNTTANLSVETPNNIRAILVGTNGSGTLQIGNPALLSATATPGRDSVIGEGSGNVGVVQQEGGRVELNTVEIGTNSSTGTYLLRGGEFVITRGRNDNSLFLGTNDSKSNNGNGILTISGGRFTTRAGVCLGSPSGGVGRFEVIGSYPRQIGVGSHNDVGGTWLQHAGSILSARIDKTTQGITPILIDEVEGGGGDVVFESGALLDVDFTAAFNNGGTFTVMQWEGDVTDNGLQFAPSVDPNIWSFQVDTANKRLTVTATGNPISRAFVHPGLSHKLSDLERMRDMVAAGVEPYATTFQELSSSSRARFTTLPGDSPSFTTLGSGTNGGVNNNNFLRNDAITAYHNALMWMLTGDSRHADASVRVLNAWSTLRRNENDVPLDTGRHWRLFEAAEIIKSTYSGWAPEDIQAFKDMIVYPGYSNTSVPTQAINNGDITFYWALYQGDPKRHGNQGLFCMRTVMAMGIFLDNEIMYDRALRYLEGASAREDDLPYPSGPPNVSSVQERNRYFIRRDQNSLSNTVEDYGYNEVVHNLIWPNGQGQEFSRDQSHALTGPGIIGTMSEIAWNQGDDLYGHLDNRLLLGLEYYYRYNLSFDNTFPDQQSPWEPRVGTGEFIRRQERTGRWFSLEPNPFQEGDLTSNALERGQHNLEPGYEMYLAHYRDRMNITDDRIKWLTRGLDLLTDELGVEPEGTIGDFATRGGLTFRRVTPGDPIEGFNNDTPLFAMNSLPTTIEAENYDYFPVDGQGHTYNDLSEANSGLSYRLADSVDLSAASEGGFAISDIEPEEWVTYTVSVPFTGTYDLSIRYASSAPGGTIQFSFDGSNTGFVSVPHGGQNSSSASDWQDFTVATEVELTQGVQQLRVNFGGASNSFSLNSLTVARASSSLIGHWNFNEGSGNIAYDSSGNGNEGMVLNAAWIQSEGRRGLDFNGSSSTVTIPGSAFEGIDDQVSIAMWTYGDPSLPSQNSVFFARDSSNGRVLNIHLPFEDSQIFWDAPDRVSKLATEAEFEGSWTHWVFTKDATSGVMNIYRNGTLFHSEENRFATIGEITLGSIGSQFNGRYWDGMIDEVRLYNVALTANEITKLFEDGSIFGLTGDVQFTTTQSETPPAVSNTDLAQSEFLSSSATGGDGVATRSAELFNGTIGNDDNDSDDLGEVRMNTDNTITIEFDTSTNTLGYDLTGITTIFGWNTGAGGRSNQGYEIILTFVDGSVRTLAGPQHWEPNNPASFWTTVSFSSSAGGPMATGVKSVSFDITQAANASQAGGFLVGREFDIFGTPTEFPDAEQLFTGGESLDVFISSATGDPGTDWSLLSLDSTLVLDSSLSQVTPFTINLMAENLATFDNSQDQSWLIVTAPQITGIFDPNTFVVNSTDFGDDNPLGGGMFTVTRIGGDLFLTFTAVTRTALENWRFTNFGTYDNIGTAADDFDFDGDGLLNILEYATSQNPKDSGESSALQIGRSPSNDDQIVVTFNTIADSSLTYTLEGSDSLLVNDWDFIKSAAGTENGTITTLRDELPASDRYFLRLRVNN